MLKINHKKKHRGIRKQFGVPSAVTYAPLNHYNIL